MGKPFFQRLASASTVEVAERFELEDAVQVITDAARILIPTDELVDKEKERARLTKEREKTLKEYAMFEKKLQNQGFLAKAPAQVVEQEKQKFEKVKELLAKIEESLAAL